MDKLSDGTPANTAASAHRAAWDLIPWVVNGSASEDERRIVEAHRAVCADCQAEFEFHQQLAIGMAAPSAIDGQADVDGALQRFWAQADAVPEEAAAAASLPARRTGAARWQRMLIAAVVVQGIGLAAVLGMLWERPRPADYQVLTAAERPGTAAASIRLVPAPGLQIGELRALLARNDLQVVQASADAGHLGLAPAPGARFDAAQALQRLRTEPGVLLAEPIAAPALR